MSAENIRELKSDLNLARRDEKRAQGDMIRCEQQAERQLRHLEALLTHRDECVNGLKNAEQSGLSIVQMREYQLLLEHINSVVQEQQEKLDVSQINFEVSREIWQRKQERTMRLNDMLESVRDADESEKSGDRLIGESPDQPEDAEKSQDTVVHGRITGKRLKTN